MLKNKEILDGFYSILYRYCKHIAGCILVFAKGNIKLKTADDAWSFWREKLLQYVESFIANT